MTDQHKSRSTESFYGRRKGQQLYGRKKRVMGELLPTLRLDPTSKPPTDLATVFGKPYERYQLEIGFGGGEHLAHQAEQAPNVGFIGVEPFINGMAKMLGAIEDRNLSNVMLFDDDALVDLAGYPF